MKLVWLRRVVAYALSSGSGASRSILTPLTRAWPRNTSERGTGQNRAEFIAMSRVRNARHLPITESPSSARGSFFAITTVPSGSHETPLVALAERRLVALCNDRSDFEDFGRFAMMVPGVAAPSDVMQLHCKSSLGAVPVRHHMVRNQDLSAGAAVGLRFGRKNLASDFVPCRSHHTTRISPMKRRVHRI